MHALGNSNQVIFLLYLEGLGSMSTGGTMLPPHYVNRYKAYYLGEWNNGQPSGIGKLYF